MHKINNKSNQGGFTIIEVMLVLAIAGLIMLIVFLAVPALQRNSRNTQRNNDASKIVAAINECMGNNNGKLASCDAMGEIDPTGNGPKYIEFQDNAQITGNMLGPISGATIGNVTLEVSELHTGAKCNSAGTGLTTVGASSRTFALIYQVETSNGTTNRCLGS